ncbi:MAG: hypothetical protein IJS13_04360 [Paludibacteraceae bacterium]|nr:hypothetical protein [Paludibacteraceae bacterium]
MIKKIVYSCLAVFFAIIIGLIAVAFIYGDVILTRAADQRLQAVNNEHFQITYSDIDVRLLHGVIRLKDVTVSLDTPSVQFTCQRIELGPIRRVLLRKNKELWFRQADIIEPNVVAQIGQKARKQEPTEQESAKKEPVDDNRSWLTKQAAEQISKIKLIGIQEIRIKQGNTELTHCENKMRVLAKGLNISVEKLYYDMQENKAVYLDSPYRLHTDTLYFLSPDGLTATSTGTIDLSDSDSIYLRKVRFGHTVKKTSLADRLGKTQVTWLQVLLNEVIISPTNIVHAITDKSIDIGNVKIKGRRLSVYRDVHYPAKEPYPMPQENLQAIPIPMHIGHVECSMPRATVEMLLPIGEAGRLDMSSLRLSVNNISNTKGATLSANARVKICGGSGNLSIKMRNNRDCTFEGSTTVENLHGDGMNSFLHPAMGINLQANISKLETSFRGDMTKAEGDMCMIYDSLKVHLVKEDVPIDKLAKNAGIINAFAPLAIHSHNPRKKGAAPYTAHFSNERNVMQNFASYVAGTIADGLMQSVMSDMIYKSVKKAMAKSKPGNLTAANSTSTTTKATTDDTKTNHEETTDNRKRRNHRHRR